MIAATVVFTKSATWKHSPMHYPVLGFLAYAIVRYFTSPLEYESRLELLRVCLYTLVYFICVCNFHHSRDRSVLIGVLVVLAVGESAYGIWQFATKSHMVLTWSRPEQYYNRGGGTYICPNHLAGFLEMVLGMLISRIVFLSFSKHSIKQSALKNIIIIYAAIVSIMGLVATLSRGGWIALAVGLLLLLIWGGWEWHKLWPRLAVAVAGLGLLALLLYKVEPVRNYIFLTLKGGQGNGAISLYDPSLGGRTFLAKTTLAMIRERPFFGTGAGTWEWFYPQYRPPKSPPSPEYPHNDLLNLISDYGFVGLILVLAALTCFYRHVILLTTGNISSEQKSMAIGSAISVTSILIHSLFDFNLHILANALLFVSLMGFAVAMDENKNRSQRVELKPAARYTLAAFLLVVAVFGVWHVVPTGLAEYCKSQGKDLTQTLQWDDAQGYYLMAIAKDPKFPTPYVKLADIYRSQSVWRKDPARRNEQIDLAKQAIASYQKSLALNPFQSEVMLRMATAYEIIGENEAALNLCKRAIEIDPVNPFNYLCIGKFYRHIGDEKNAIEAYEKANSLNFGYNDLTAPFNLEELRKP